MKIRKYLFIGLMLLSLLWIAFSIINVQQAREKAQANNSTAAGQVGTAIGSNLAFNCTVVPGVFLAIIFGILAYRSHLALKKRNMPEEALPKTTLDPHLE